MTLSIDRLKNAINYDGPKGLRRLLSEYIRLSCLLELQRTSLLEIKLEVNKITNSIVSNQSLHVKQAVRCKKFFTPRYRSLTQTNSKLIAPSSLFAAEDVSRKPFRRSRSHSAKAAYL